MYYICLPIKNVNTMSDGSLPDLFIILYSVLTWWLPHSKHSIEKF